MSEDYHYLFGPVPSRRLGRSLGIDVTPSKTCSFDCIYCQCGCTTRKTPLRSEFVPFEDVCAEINQWLAGDEETDVITFAGSGEPTLYSRLGDLIAFIKEKTAVPVIVLSNGTLFHRQMVRDDLMGADIVKTTLSAWDEESFQRIHRPAPGITFDQLLAGARDFRREYSGTLWLEVFLMEGINSAPEQVQLIAAAAGQIGPDRIHLNTAVRPPTETDVLPVPENALQALCNLFTPTAEVIASFPSAAPAKPVEVSAGELAALIRRHPATADQLAAVCGSSAAAVEASLAPLIDAGRLQSETRDGVVWYK